MDTAAAAIRQRDRRVIGLVGVAHFFSHFYQLAFAPLFPFVVAAEGLSYTQLGVVMTIFYVSSGLMMTPMGYLVDKIGARNTLTAGLTLLAAATVGYGLTDSYWVMCILAVFAGTGNGTFHPCDYSILGATISEERMGRAYSVHNFGGHFGYAVAPATMVALASAIGWRPAIIAAGLCAVPVIFLLFTRGGEFRDSTHIRKEEGGNADVSILSLVTQVPVLLCFLFFALIAGTMIGLQSFAPAALHAAFDTPIAAGNAALTCYLLGSPVGILLGGWIVDRMKRPDVIATAGYGLGALLVVLIALAPMPQVLLMVVFAVVGLTFGLAFPARDLLVRSVTPRGSSGKVFGFVYAGMDLGAASMPAILGWLMDAGEPQILFLLIAGCAMSALFSLLATRRGNPQSAAAAAE